MISIFIDESGSITNKTEKQKYFVIALLKVNDIKSLLKSYKRFISARLEKLKESDIKNEMFEGNKFREIKGNAFSPELKKEFVKYFARNEYFELYYIILQNQKLTDSFCKNTARAFNFSLRKNFEYLLNKELIEKDTYYLQLDERNEKTEAKYFLENYLNTEIAINYTEDINFKVKYYDSASQPLIQIADVFSNLMYSNLITNNYYEEIEMLKENGYIKNIYFFPLG